jgi:hypothetical protein
MSYKTFRIKGVHIRNDPASPKVQKRAEEHIKASKFSNIITTGHYRVLEVVRPARQVQQRRPPKESAQTRTRANGVEGTNRGTQHWASINGRMKWHKPDIRKDSKGNVYIIGKLEADRLLFPRHSTREHKSSPRENQARCLLWRQWQLPQREVGVLSKGLALAIPCNPGRPAFAKFMAVPHYAYLTLKIPGPKGTITVQGSFEVSNTCDKEFNRMAQTFGMTAEYARLKGETDHNVLPDVGQSLLD